MGRSLFEALEPRRDVVSGTLTESMFAASLDSVAADSGPDVYREASTFFRTCHPSAGLRALLNEALGRVSGRKPDAASVIRLETSLGGGKTHNLIALYHAAKGRLDPGPAAEFMDPAVLSPGGVDQLAVFVGTGAGATDFPAVHGIKPQTLWGYLAVQLDGIAGYDLVRAADEALTAPGSAALRQLLRGRPTLILIDEIARYYITAVAKTVGGSNLARQTTAFLMALMEAVDTEPGAALVITTTGTEDAFGDATDQVLTALAEAQSLMARKELVLRPSEEADLPRILTRRLFEPPSGEAIEAVAAAYAEAAREATAHGTELPQRMTAATWVGEVKRTYPFHPALIRVMDKRLSTIPNFNRTRGALRLLARAIRRLWDIQPAGTQLIHLHHIDLSVPEIADELSSRLDRSTFEPVIRADIASQPGGEPSHAELVDIRRGMSRHEARRLASTAYLWSLTRDVPSVSTADLVGSVLEPDDDPNVLRRAFDDLLASAWYLHSDVRGHYFSTEASLAKLIQETENGTSSAKVREHATRLLSSQFQTSSLTVRRTWEDRRVPDQHDKAWLVIFHWDDFGDTPGVDPSTPEPPRIVQETLERKPDGGLREYRNRLVLLAPNANQHEAMLNAVRRHLALRELSEHAEVLSRLSPENRAKLNDLFKESQLEARVAVCNHMSVLYVPQAGGPEALVLDSVTKASLRQNQTDAVTDRLAAEDKTLTSSDRLPDPRFVKSKLGALLDQAAPTSRLAEAFARRTDLKLVLDAGQFVRLIAAGVQNGVWEYHDAARGHDGWATVERPSSVQVRLADDTWLYPVGSAPDRQPVACPFCGKVHKGPDPCPTDDDDQDRDHGARRSVAVEFSATGSAAVALVQARDNAATAGRAQARALRFSIDETGAGTAQQLMRLLSVVPAGVPGTTLHYEIKLDVPLGSAADNAVKIEFKGAPDDYQLLREAVRQLLSTRQAVVKGEVEVVFDPPIGLDDDSMGQLRQRAADTGPARCAVRITTTTD